MFYSFTAYDSLILARYRNVSSYLLIHARVGLANKRTAHNSFHDLFLHAATEFSTKTSPCEHVIKREA